MILLDANMILRYLAQPTTPAVRAQAETARALFAAVQRREIEVTTTEVVLHEVAYVLASKHLYGMAAGDIAASLKVILRLPNFKLPDGQKRRYLRALDLYANDPVLGLADAIIAATALEQGIELASFDAHFDRIPGLVRWQRPVPSTEPDETGN